MKFILKMISIILVFFISTQVILPIVVPSKLVYNNRQVYEVFKNSEYNFEIAIQEIKKIINRDNIKNYAIILGDSVSYSSPCQPENSITSYMNAIAEKEGKQFRVFNLAAPSMIAGDIYIALKLLDEYKISTKNLIINLSYWDFRVTCPTFWLKGYMRKIEPAGYSEMVGAPKNSFIFWDSLKWDITHAMVIDLSVIKYREFISYKFKKDCNSLLGQVIPIKAIPWYKKSGLKESLNSKENRWYYTDKPFYLDKNNVQVKYLEKIIEHQHSKNTVIFLPAMNDALLGDAVRKQGYIDNMRRIDEYFYNKDIKYINYNGKVNYNLFSDHIHLIEDGYKFLANDLWSKVTKNMEVY